MDLGGKSALVEDEVLGDPGPASAVVELVVKVEGAVGVAGHGLKSCLVSRQHQRVAHDVRSACGCLSETKRTEQKNQPQILHPDPLSELSAEIIYTRND